MIPPRVWLHYRPVRIGWAVNGSNLDEFEEAVRLTCCLWGGRFNPIIPTHNLALARNLVHTFGVDLIIPMQDTPEVKLLIDEFPHLISGIHGRAVFKGEDPRRCLYADIYHPARRLYEDAYRTTDESNAVLTRPSWEPDDPLNYVLAAMFGRYPDAAQTGLDYGAMLDQWLKAEKSRIGLQEEIDPSLSQRVPPLGLTTYEIRRTRREGWRAPGLVIGHASSLDDLILFWNLRAAETPVWFYDISHSKRLRPWVDGFLSEVQEREFERPLRLNIWSRQEKCEHDLDLGGFEAAYCVERDAATWNGLNIKPPKARFTDSHIDVIPAYSENVERRSVSFPLPQKPFYTDDPHTFGQRFVVTARISQFREVENDLTFTTPFMPRLNEFYGRNFHHDYSAARSEKDELGHGAIGIITDINSQQETVRAVRVQDFLKALFSVVGARMTVSQPGLICSRLIAQLGGVQGCRVLKVRGARELIRRYEPDKSFTRGVAWQIINDVDATTKKPKFSDFEDLYIEHRDTQKLKPSDVFAYLISKGVFRVGLDLKCPNCLLGSWLHIDEVKSVSRCEYCGFDFDITPQLRDRDWRYRRSGLFGRSDEQHGSIPVAVTIQQLDTVLNDRALIYSTALEFHPTTAEIEDCEADFVMLVAGFAGLQENPTQILFGECKTTGPIEEADARKLGKLADAVDRSLADPYIMFAKTGVFGAEEIEIAKSLNSKYHQRVILWSRDELEPYFVYERSKDRLGQELYASGLSEMANVTSRLFFGVG